MIRARAVTLQLFIALSIAGCRGGEESQTDSEQAGLPPDFSDMTPIVVLETNKGTIVLELDRAKAEKTVDSIVLHVTEEFYDGLIFHRVIPGFMIQVGSFTPQMAQRQSSVPELMNEADNGLKNVRGSVAMARISDPHSAKSQFFINLADNGQLDHTSKSPGGWGYTVFGHVIEGMEVVDSIAAVRTQTVGPYDDVPVEAVVIERAYIRSE